MSESEMFAVWYSEYPRHVARKDAEKAWGKLELTEELFQEILRALLIQKQTVWRGKDRQYLPYPASWIRGERWLDEIDVPPEHSPGTEAARSWLEGRLKREKATD